MVKKLAKNKDTLNITIIKKIIIIIPIAPFEPISIIKKSLESISFLNKKGLAVKIIYTIGASGPNDYRIKAFLNIIKKNKDKKDIKLIVRAVNKGKKAEMLNNVINKINKKEFPDFFVFFDIDSRPNSNFLIECISLFKNKKIKIVSSVRYITNLNINKTTLFTSFEYAFFEYVYIYFNKINGFLLFNGLIGFVSSDVFKKLKFNENVSCEDLMLIQNIYLNGGIAKLSKNTYVGEQSPLSLGEYYKQRLRWISGAYESFFQYSLKFIKAKVPLKIKITWFFTIISPFIAVFIMFFSIFFIKKNKKLSFLEIIRYSALIQLCSLVVIYKKIVGKKIKWFESKRSNN